MNNVNSSELLARYDAMLHLSQQMLEAARQDEWERLIELEQARSSVLDEIRKIDIHQWPEKEGARKAEVIQAILVIDTEVKTLTESWMGELRNILGNIGVEKKLNKAYESV